MTATGQLRSVRILAVLGRLPAMNRRSQPSHRLRPSHFFLLSLLEVAWWCVPFRFALAFAPVPSSQTRGKCDRLAIAVFMCRKAATTSGNSDSSRRASSISKRSMADLGSVLTNSFSRSSAPAYTGLAGGRKCGCPPRSGYGVTRAPLIRSHNPISSSYRAIGGFITWRTSGEVSGNKNNVTVPVRNSNEARRPNRASGRGTSLALKSK